MRRTTPLADSDVTIPRSIMAEKFPPDSTIEDLMSFFNTFAPVLSVRLIRTPKNREFKGAALIELDSQESANKLLAQQISYKDQKLTLKSKLEHLKMVDKMRKESDAAANNKEEAKSHSTVKGKGLERARS